MKIKILKKGFNYSQDGTGNRLVYHLQGCNMKCPWCANPEGISTTSNLAMNNSLSVCRYKEYDIDFIVNEVNQSRMLFFDGGGVTLSGGEPTVQFSEVKELFVKLKNNGINTAIETNGTNQNLEELFTLTDMLIMDFKHYDNDIHLNITGIGNEVIKENIKKACEKHNNVLIRTPLINGFNASEENLKGFIEFYKGFDITKVKFEFLRYHEFGKVKWEECNMDYKVENGFISEERLELFEETFKKNGMVVVRT